LNLGGSAIVPPQQRQLPLQHKTHAHNATHKEAPTSLKEATSLQAWYLYHPPTRPKLQPSLPVELALTASLPLPHKTSQQNVHGRHKFYKKKAFRQEVLLPACS